MAAFFNSELVQTEFSDQVRQDLQSIVQLTRANYDQSIYIVGTVSQMLSGIDVIPRDIDLLLPERISPADFCDRILSRLGYVDSGKFVWSKAGDGQAQRHLAISHPNHVGESNPFAAALDHGFGWEFPDCFWRPVPLTPTLEVFVPSPALSIWLKFKSVADKIYLCRRVSEGDAEFWKALLINDFKCLYAEVSANHDQYSLEEVWSVLGCFPNNPEVARQLLGALDFSIDVLDARYGGRTDTIRVLKRLANFYFTEDVRFRAPTVERIPDESSERSPARNFFTDPATGAIYSLDGAGVHLDGTTLDHPIIASIQLNATCNMQCAHCDYPMDGSQIDLPLLEQKLVELRDAGVLQVNFGEGSEAMLYPQLAEALKLTAELGLIPNLSTNLSIEPDAKLRRAIVENCGAVAVSIDKYHLPKLGKLPRDHAFYSRIRWLCESDVFVIVNTVYDCGDVSQLRPIVAIAAELGCDAICIIRRFFEQGRVYRRLPIGDFAELADVVREGTRLGLIVGFHSSDPVSNVFTRPRRMEDTPISPMTEGRHSIFLDSQGAFRPSSFSPIGDQSFADVLTSWRSERFDKYRQMTDSGMALVS